MGNDGLTLDAVAEIQADAHRAVTRQFRDAAEDSGWKPTEWRPKDDLSTFGQSQTVSQEKPVFTEAGKPVETKTEATGPSIDELRARAKELDLSAGGSKQALQERIVAAEAENTNNDNPEGGNQ